MTTRKLEICPKCKRKSRTVERRPMSTAYVDKEANYTTCCADCFREIEKYWRERWADYYADCM